MLRLLSACFVLACLLPLAGAAWFDDEVANGGGLDLVRVSWSHDATTASVLLDLASDYEEGAAYQAAFYMGDEGSPEPDEWYVLFMKPGDGILFAGHQEVERRSLHADANGTVVSTTFERVSPSAGNCTFAVAVTGRYAAAGFQQIDQVPDAMDDFADAWQLGAPCNPDWNPQAKPQARSVDAVGPRLALFVAPFVALAMLRRR